MWQRFTERARRVVFHAQEEAQKFGDGYVSTEHLLLGLLREPDSVAAQALEKLGISLNHIRVEVEKQLPKSDARPSQDMTLTPRAKRVIDLAYDEARLLTNNYIGTEHLLLGLIREQDGLAARVLAKLGVDLERARREVAAIQADTPVQARSRPSVPSLGSDVFKPLAWSAYGEDAQSALYRAKATANGLGETHLTPLHLVLALLDDEDSGAIRALREAGLEPERLRAEVERQRVWAEGAPDDIQLSRNGRKTMDAATVEARSLGSERLGSEHILLGLARGNPEGVGRILADLGLDLRRLRETVYRLDSKAKGDEAPEPESEPD